MVDRKSTAKGSQQAMEPIQTMRRWSATREAGQPAETVTQAMLPKALPPPITYRRASSRMVAAYRAESNASAGVEQDAGCPIVQVTLENNTQRDEATPQPIRHGLWNEMAVQLIYASSKACDRYSGHDVFCRPGWLCRGRYHQLYRGWQGAVWQG